MAENNNKSKEEIALELLQIILSGTIQSGDNQKSVREKIDLHTSSIEDKYKWYLTLYENCLNTVKGQKEID